MKASKYFRFNVDGPQKYMRVMILFNIDLTVTRAESL